MVRPIVVMAIIVVAAILAFVLFAPVSPIALTRVDVVRIEPSQPDGRNAQAVSGSQYVGVGVTSVKETRLVAVSYFFPMSGTGNMVNQGESARLTISGFGPDAFAESKPVPDEGGWVEWIIDITAPAGTEIFFSLSHEGSQSLYVSQGGEPAYNADDTTARFVNARPAFVLERVVGLTG